LSVAGKIAGGVIDVIAGVFKVLNGLISGAVAGINALIGAYNAIPFLPNVNKISAPTVSVPSISTPTIKSPTIPTVPTVPTGTTTGTAGGGGVTTAAKTAAAAAAASTGISVGSNFNPGSFRMAEAATSGDTYNINVTGALDKEGVARQIVDILNNSSARGGGGFNALVAV
jgi:hypothetical protein